MTDNEIIDSLRLAKYFSYILENIATCYTGEAKENITIAKSIIEQSHLSEDSKSTYLDALSSAREKILSEDLYKAAFSIGVANTALWNSLEKGAVRR